MKRLVYDGHDNRKGMCGLLLLSKELVLLALQVDRWCHSSLACFESVLLLQLDLSEGSLQSWACLWECSQQKIIKMFHGQGTQSGLCRWF